MRIVFLGTPEFTLPILEACARAGELALVVAQPDKPVGRHQELQAPASKRWAVEHGIPVAQPAKVKNGALAKVLAAARPDVAVVAAYGRILPPDARGCRRTGASTCTLPSCRSCGERPPRSGRWRGDTARPA